MGRVHFPLGLANDQLGYLISPAEAWPMVAVEVAVNDNSIFNVSQTIGDYVMCASIANAQLVLAPGRRVAPLPAVHRRRLFHQGLSLWKSRMGVRGGTTRGRGRRRGRRGR